MSSSGMADQVSHNVYFDGKVQSLGIETEKGKATVGVIKKGTYVFNTSSLETMVIIAGTMNAKVKGGEWISYKKDNAFEVAANSSFEVRCEADVAYICYYN
ncbi:MAG TPA: pyrimidine/purine nucleoside phosphorylase [Niastella sp.]|nr:pyrimidine/purine nucleoside phosphorylase [Niastella sp.]